MACSLASRVCTHLDGWDNECIDSESSKCSDCIAEHLITRGCCSEGVKVKITNRRVRKEVERTDKFFAEPDSIHSSSVNTECRNLWKILQIEIIYCHN